MFDTAPWRAWVGCLMLLFAQLAAGGALASRLPLGLDGRERVYVQEHWKADVPVYCVANARDQAIRLRVSRWLSRDQAPKPISEWDIPARQLVCVETPQLLGEWLLYFSLADGTRLGLLKAPVRPPRAEGAPRAGIGSYQGLNGACGERGLWLEQERLCHDSGAPIVLDLMTRPRNGQIVIATPGAGDNLGLDALTALRATSETLPVRVADGRIEIDTDQARAGSEPHRIRVEYAPVSVASATLFSIGTRQQGSGGRQGCFVRGVCVQP